MAATKPAKTKPPTKPPTKTPTKSLTKVATKKTLPPKAPPAPPKRTRVKVAFPKKNAPPTEAEFSARLPLAAGKRFEMVRAFLKKQKAVTEELFYYGPKTGWAFRYLRNVRQSICSIMIHDERLLGIVAMDAASMAAIGWSELSPVAQKARKLAHGSPTMLWLDLPLDGTGAADFKILLKGKLKTLPLLPPPPPPAGGAAAA